MTCFMCKGTTEQKLKPYVATLEDCIIIIKNVPALVCTQCGEVYYTDEVATQLERIIETMEKIVQDVAVFEYSKVVA